MLAQNPHRKPKRQTQASHSTAPFECLGVLSVVEGLMALSKTLSEVEGSKIERARFCRFLFLRPVLSHSSVFDSLFELNRKDTELIKPFSLTAAYAHSSEA